MNQDGQIFVGDTPEIRLDARIDCSGYESGTVQIRYEKPSGGGTGVWTATLVDGEEAEGELPLTKNVFKYQCQGTDLDTAGTWYLQPYAYNSADDKHHGEKFALEVEAPIAAP